MGAQNFARPERAALLGKACALMVSIGTSCGAGGWSQPSAERTAPLRQFASGRERTASSGGDQIAQGSERPLVTYAQKGGENVLAGSLAPLMVAAIAAGNVGGKQVDPVRLGAPGDLIPTGIQMEGAELGQRSRRTGRRGMHSDRELGRTFRPPEWA